MVRPRLRTSTLIGTPLPVAGHRRGIADHILLVQLRSQACGGGIEIPEATDDFRAAARVVGQFPQRARVDPFVAFDSQGIHQHFAGADRLLNALHAVSAVPVIAIGEHQERLLHMTARGGSRQRGAHRVEQRRSILRLRPVESTAERAAVRRPGLHHSRDPTEFRQEQLVILVEEVEGESVDRDPGRRHLVRGHAATDVEDDPEAHWYPFTAEVHDFLRLALVIDDEVLLPEARYEPAVAVGDRRGDIDEVDAAFEDSLWLSSANSGRRHGGQQGSEDQSRSGWHFSQPSRCKGRVDGRRGGRSGGQHTRSATGDK